MKFYALLILVAAPMLQAMRLSIPPQMTIKGGEARSSAAAAALAVVLSGACPAFAGDIDAGQLIFKANCAACHAGGNNVIVNEKTLKKEALVDYLAGGFKEASIAYQVTNGKNAMPAFGGRLTDEEISDVASFVFDQASGEKW